MLLWVAANRCRECVGGLSRRRVIVPQEYTRHEKLASNPFQ